MSVHDLLWFSLASALVAILTHMVVRRYALAVFVGAVAASLANVGYEIAVQDFAVRPDDAFFWLPMMFVHGVVITLPVAAIVGVPFFAIRHRKMQVTTSP